MPYAYAGLATLKSDAWLDVDVTIYDALLLTLLEAASERIDHYLGRQVQPRTETLYFDGDDGSEQLWVPDLLSVTTLKTDENGDGTYERTWAAADYILWPLNRWPKRRVDRDRRTGSSQWAFYRGQRTVEIAGIWGYGTGESATPITASGTTTNEALDASETGVDVVSSSPFEVGETILIDSEQMYVTAITGNTLTVRRGANGSTAATHSTSTAISIYEYPGQVVTACLIQASRLWKRKDSAFATVAGGSETGQVEIVSGLDHDVKMLLSGYRAFDQARLVAV